MINTSLYGQTLVVWSIFEIARMLFNSENMWCWPNNIWSFKVQINRLWFASTLPISIQLICLQYFRHKIVKICACFVNNPFNIHIHTNVWSKECNSLFDKIIKTLIITRKDKISLDLLDLADGYNLIVWEIIMCIAMLATRAANLNDFNEK